LNLKRIPPRHKDAEKRILKAKHFCSFAVKSGSKKLHENISQVVRAIR